MPIELALLGCAHPHVPDVLGVVASEPDVRLAAAWDADPDAIPGAIAGAAVQRVETAVRRANAAVVCVPGDQRPAVCVQAARAGCPILILPPVARTAAEARAVAREVARSRTPAMAALHLRELPALRRLAGIVREGLLGRISGITASLQHPGLLDGWFDGPRGWLLDPERAGTGGFGELGVHLLDALASLPADEPPRLAAVTLDRREPRRTEVGGVGLGSAAGVPLTVTTSRATRPGGLEIVVRGARGTAVLRDGVLEVDRGGPTPERWVGAPPDPGEAVRAFTARIRARRLPRDGLADAVRAQEALEAAVRL